MQRGNWWIKLVLPAPGGAHTHVIGPFRLRSRRQKRRDLATVFATVGRVVFASAICCQTGADPYSVLLVHGRPSKASASALLVIRILLR